MTYHTDHTPLAAALKSLAPDTFAGIVRHGQNWHFHFEGDLDFEECERLFHRRELDVDAKTVLECFKALTIKVKNNGL
jgi:hypothetical protein